MDWGVYSYVCDGPLEINGSHWHCSYAGAAASGTVGVSAGILVFNANASVSATLGDLHGACWFACPDLSQAQYPNPPASWQQGYVKPVSCKKIGPSPMSLAPPPLDAPPGPPNPLAPPPP
jgi:hypothetical protein